MFFGADHLFVPEDWARFAPTLTSLQLNYLASPVTAAHMRALCALPHLETLWLGRRDLLTGQASDLASLTSISTPKLRFLQLECAQLSTLRFSCPELTSLTLRACTHPGESSSFAGCTRLQRLAIMDSDVGAGNGAAWLAEQLHSLTTLEHLRLFCCNLSAVPYSLTSLGSLQYLCMRNNRISQLPDNLPRSLRDVHLDRKCFTCVPSKLYTLSCLEILGLSDQDGQISSWTRPCCRSFLCQTCALFGLLGERPSHAGTLTHIGILARLYGPSKP